MEKKITSRSEALEIWKLIANGILNIDSSTPSIHYTPALDFIQEVAKKIIEAELEPSGKRPDAIVRAVRLSGKNIKFETEVTKVINLINDFYPTYIGKNINLAGDRNNKICKALRSWAKSSGDINFNLYLESM